MHICFKVKDPLGGDRGRAGTKTNTVAAPPLANITSDASTSDSSRSGTGTKSDTTAEESYTAHKQRDGYLSQKGAHVWSNDSNSDTNADDSDGSSSDNTTTVSTAQVRKDNDALIAPSLNKKTDKHLR